MTKKELLEFVEQEMMEENETLPRDPEEVGPFAVALVELAGGGFENRVAQPATILRNKKTSVAPVVTVEVYGRNHYQRAAKRFNNLVDKELA